MVRTVLIHEFASGGGLAGVDDAPSSWKAEGSAMRRALAEDFACVEGFRVRMTLDARLADEPGPWDLIRVDAGAELETLDRLAASSDLTVLVAPESNGLLLDRTLRIKNAGGRSMGSSLPAIALCGDKALLGRWLIDRGIPTPRSIVIRPSERLPVDFPYPAVLKPIDGAGSIATFAIGRPDRLPEGVSISETVLLQPYLAGEPMSASFLVDAAGAAHLIGFSRQRVEVVEGRFSYLGGTIPVRPEPPIEVILAAIQSIKGLKGWVGVDFVWKASSGQLSILEINPRLTTSYVGFRQLAVKGALARAWIAAVDHPGAFDFEAIERAVRASREIDFEADGRFHDLEEIRK